eukprot:1185630-Prorocentrum_minimum.AAC.4
MVVRRMRRRGTFSTVRCRCTSWATPARPRASAPTGPPWGGCTCAPQGPTQGAGSWAPPAGTARASCSPKWARGCSRGGTSSAEMGKRM